MWSLEPCLSTAHGIGCRACPWLAPLPALYCSLIRQQNLCQSKDLQPDPFKISQHCSSKSSQPPQSGSRCSPGMLCLQGLRWSPRSWMYLQLPCLPEANITSSSSIYHSYISTFPGLLRRELHLHQHWCAIRISCPKTRWHEGDFLLGHFSSKLCFGWKALARMRVCSFFLAKAAQGTNTKF